MPLISIEDLSKSYGSKQVLDHLNLEIPEKEIFGIIGMTGVGKTTLFFLMLGQEKASSGCVKIKKNGKLVDVREAQTQIKTQIGFSTQKPSFYDHLTAKENLLYFADLYGIDENTANDRIRELIKFVDLEADLNTLGSDLSGGMQKRLDIACALIHNPPIVFLDEPTADLDPVMRKQIWNLLKKIHAEGRTIVLSSHFLDEIENLCTSLAIIHNKKVVRQGSLDKVKKLFNIAEEVIIETKSGKYENIIKKIKRTKIPIESIEEEDKRLIIRTKQTKNLLKKMMSIVETTKEDIIGFDVRRPKLHEVFEKITKEDL